MNSNPQENRIFRITALITAINVLVASGFSIAGVASPKSILPPGLISNESTHIFAMYAAARTIPIAIFTLAIIYKRAVSALLLIGCLAGSIQFVDIFLGLYQHDLGKAAGPFILATLQFFSIRMLYGTRHQ